MTAQTLVRPEVVSGRFVEGMDEDEYFAHPALSASGMKLLLRSPKHFRLDRSLVKPRREFDEGHAVHARVLGVGAPIKEIPDRLLSGEYRSISSKEAKKFKADAEADGFTVLKPAQYARIVRASDAVLSHAKAQALLEAAPFREVSLFATDPESGVDLRGRVDAVGEHLVDVKTTTDVRTRKITNAVVDFGYDISAVVYRRLLQLVTGDDPGPMHLIFVEKEPPYEVRVVRLADPVWQAVGEEKMRAAIDLFAWCQERGEWPGDDEDGGPIQDLPAPAWYGRQMFEEESL